MSPLENLVVTAAAALLAGIAITLAIQWADGVCRGVIGEAVRKHGEADR